MSVTATPEEPALFFHPAEPHVTAAGKWAARYVPANPDVPRGKRRSLVTITFEGREVYRSHGVNVYEIARTYIAQLAANGHTPDLSGRRCLADLSPAERIKACLPKPSDKS